MGKAPTRAQDLKHGDVILRKRFFRPLGKQQDAFGPREGTEICNFGTPSPLDIWNFLQWIFPLPWFLGWEKKRGILSRLWLSWFFGPDKRFWVGLFYLRVSLFYLRSVFVAYGQLAWSFLLTVWSFLLTVENRFGLFCLRFPPVRKLGLVFFTYGSPRLEIGFGLFCLRFPHRK